MTRRGPLLGFGDARRVMREMRRLREEAGVRSDELAARLGHPAVWVCQREQGAVRVSAAEVPLIEEALGVPAGTLLGGDVSGDRVTAGRRERTGTE